MFDQKVTLKDQRNRCALIICLEGLLNRTQRLFFIVVQQEGEAARGVGGRTERQLFSKEV